MNRYRLQGGPRDGEIVDEVPEGYTRTGIGYRVGNYPDEAHLMGDIPESATYDEAPQSADSEGPVGDSAD